MNAGLLGITLVALAQAQTATEVVLHNFAPQTRYYPNGVIRDSAGNIYGSTVGGGTGEERTLRSLPIRLRLVSTGSPTFCAQVRTKAKGESSSCENTQTAARAGGAPWTETVLYSFTRQEISDS